jgi:hypothetical protein
MCSILETIFVITVHGNGRTRVLDVSKDCTLRVAYVDLVIKKPL